MDISSFQRIVVPVANHEDAAATAAAVTSQAEGTDCAVIAVNAIEKAPGAPGKISPEQYKQDATEIFRVVEDALEKTGMPVESDLRYGEDVAASVIEATHETHATEIMFTPRGGSRWQKLLTGDVTHKLVANSDISVVVLPDDADGNPRSG